jgi:ribosomal protein S6--L-glutamate ligase
MKAAIISLGSKSSLWTYEAMKKYFETVDLLDLRMFEVNFSGDKAEILYEGEALKKYDCIYAKGSFRYASILANITARLYKNTYMPLTPESFTLCHDKLLTQMELQKYNIPMPKTYLAATIKAVKKNLEKMNYPIVMKFPKGTQGKGVMFAESYSSASSILDALNSLNQPFLLQEFIDTDGSDIRALVIGDKVVASMKRKSDVNENRANIHSGGKAESVILDEHSKRIAVKAAKSTGAEICGVDILESHKGPLVLEINLSPGLQGISTVSSVDIPDKLAKYLYNQTLLKKESKKKKESEEVMRDIDVNNTKELITNVDFRGERILIPEIITKMSKIKDSDTIQLTANNGKIEVKKLTIDE